MPWVDDYITDANGIFFALATSMISVGELGDATRLMARVGEELRCRAPLHMNIGGWLYTHPCWCLGDWTKGIRGLRVLQGVAGISHSCVQYERNGSWGGSVFGKGSWSGGKGAFGGRWLFV